MAISRNIVGWLVDNADAAAAFDWIAEPEYGFCQYYI